MYDIHSTYTLFLYNESSPLISKRGYWNLRAIKREVGESYNLGCREISSSVSNTPSQIKNERATMYGCKKDGFGHGEQTIALRQQDAVKRVVSTSQLSTSELPEDEMEEFLTVNW